MDNLEQIEKRIIEKQQIFNKITLKRQRRMERNNKKNQLKILMFKPKK